MSHLTLQLLIKVSTQRISNGLITNLMNLIQKHPFSQMIKVKSRGNKQLEKIFLIKARESALQEAIHKLIDKTH